MGTDNFVRLEEAVHKLIDSHASLENENGKLLALLKTRNAEIDWLKGKLRALDKEKGLLREKVDGLIERLDGLV
jgi:predicted nuclease with TOPRIM domain